MEVLHGLDLRSGLAGLHPDLGVSVGRLPPPELGVGHRVEHVVQDQAVLAVPHELGAVHDVVPGTRHRHVGASLNMVTEQCKELLYCG